MSTTQSSQTNSLRYGVFETPLSNLLSNRFFRLMLVAIGVGLCLWTIRAAATIGVSSLLVRFAFATRSLDVAKKANQMNPRDAQGHLAEAAVLSSLSRPAESVIELERAVALRPADYSLWIELGLLRDQLGETDAALAAFNEAINRAPFYARPRWQRGNLLLRAGQYDAGFKDLSKAAQSNPELIAGLMDLAWSLSMADSNLTEQWAELKTDQRRIAFAKFLARNGRPKESVAQLRAVSLLSGDVGREVVEQLIANGAFEEAFELWKVTKGQAVGNEQSTAEISDGGFEAQLAFDSAGFGWRVPRAIRGLTLSLDSSHSHSGSRNLRIDFAGDSNPGSELISQLIRVRPSTRYRINFASRSQDVVTGGSPMIVVNDASAERKRLGQSAALAKGTVGWQVLSFEFITNPTTTAIQLGLQRENCSTSPCPIFGSIGLDSFSVEQLK